MALSHKLELRQSQSLVMTPQLMQAIKLLQLSHLDLIAYVDAELERNPLLERAESEDGGPEAPAPEPEEARESSGDFVEESSDWLETRLDTDAQAIEQKLDTDLGNVYQDDNGRAAAETAPVMPGESWNAAPSRQAVSSEDYNLEAFVAGDKTLAEHLSEQLGLAVADPTGRLIGLAIINEIDEAGYLRADLAGIAERLGAPLADVQAALAVVQSFEPPGVGARDLAECLAIQLRERDRLDPAMAALVGHLDLVARYDHAGLMRACGVDAEDLADMLAELRALNPKPGHAFGDTVVQPVIPDVLVRPAPDGGWLIELNSGTLPRVLVNQTYYAKVARGRKNDADKTYLADCLQTANWLVKSLDQRARTILKVASEIVRQQDAFFAEGVQHLRPLNLKTVAEAIGMHESTVSRVTSNKYMATTRGIFEMKYFFTASIPASGGGEAHSAEAVRYRIRKLIDDEPADAILSDDTIVKVLRDSGVDIARRTVAKYREAMRIPSSVQRRREKQAAG
ncbi:MAG: RNA polymerase factor sigma-54 [Rhizobiales bacterium]|nr:RNA polymerase factor sigma-54 [Hyphomicrobiales bacterium]